MREALEPEFRGRVELCSKCVSRKLKAMSRQRHNARVRGEGGECVRGGAGGGGGDVRDAVGGSGFCHPPGSL